MVLNGLRRLTLLLRVVSLVLRGLLKGGWRGKLMRRRRTQLL
jgi:hypothetical protein